MDLQSAFNDINWLSVVVASASAFAIGSLWYSPLLLGNIWQKELKLSNDDIKNANMPMIFGLAFVLELWCLTCLLAGKQHFGPELWLVHWLASLGWLPPLEPTTCLPASHSACF